MNINEKIIEIMEMVITKEDGTVEFTEEAKKLIHETAKDCRSFLLYQQNKAKQVTYEEGLTAEEIYLDMCNKIINAPTHFHMAAVPIMLIPVIDDKLKPQE